MNVKDLNVTQGMNSSFSHKGVLAIDMGKACEYLKAPFTGIVKRTYPTDNEVWLESVDKVMFANGTIDYMTLLVMHDNSITSLPVGRVVNQGEIFYQPGTKGYATGPHIHITVGRGKFFGKGWYKNSNGQWCINNQYDITKALFLHKDVKVSNGMYNWKVTDNYHCDTKPDVLYRAYDNNEKIWLDRVTNYNNSNSDGYAGWIGHSIGGIKVKLSTGEKIYITSHIKGGKWLEEVSKYDNTDDGYSGIYGKPIDAVMIKSSVGTACYRVHLKGGKWLDWVTGYSKTDKYNGYAGIIGKEIDAIQIYIK